MQQSIWLFTLAVLANSHLGAATRNHEKHKGSLAPASVDYSSKEAHEPVKSLKKQKSCSISVTEVEATCDVFPTQSKYELSSQATTRWKKYELAAQLACGSMQYVLTAVDPAERPSVCASLGMVSTKEESCKGLKHLECSKECNLQCHNLDLCKHQTDECIINTMWTHCGKIAVPCERLRCDNCTGPKLLTFEDVPIGDNYFFPDLPEDVASEWDYNGFHLINYKIYFPGRNPDFANEINSVISSDLVLGNVVPDEDATLYRKKPFTLGSMFITLTEMAPLGVYHEGLVTIKALRRGNLIGIRKITINSNAPVLFAPSDNSFKNIDTLQITPPTGVYFDIDNVLLCV